MNDIKLLTSCQICKTKWYIGVFENIDCPKCHGDPEKVESPFTKDDSTLVDFLCPVCFVAWQQPADEKFKCPACGTTREHRGK